MISETIKAFINVGIDPPLFFWRDRTGHEVDLVIKKATSRCQLRSNRAEPSSGIHSRAQIPGWRSRGTVRKMARLYTAATRLSRGCDQSEAVVCLKPSWWRGPESNRGRQDFQS